MDWLKALWTRLRRTLRSRALECELDEELALHVELEAEKNLRAGMESAEARRAALLAFGGVERYREATREAGRVQWLDRVNQDLRFGLRALVRAPVFTVVVTASLALGIGANTAIFSLIEQQLLRRLPVSDPEGLVNLVAPGPKPGSKSTNQGGDADALFSYPMFRDLTVVRSGLGEVAAHRAFEASLAFAGRTLAGQGVLVSGSYFPALGVDAALGRVIGRAEDEVEGAHPVVVLSDRFWRTYAGASRDVIGETVAVNGRIMTIIGVAPGEFDGTTSGIKPDVFVPITMAEVMAPALALDDRSTYWAYVFGRLNADVTIERAAARLNTAYRRIIEEVEVPLQSGLSEATMAQFRAKEVVLRDGSRGQSTVHVEARGPLLLLLSITGIVLLTACANTANLVLARGTSRGVELAVRQSLGASRGRLVGQLLTESGMLAVAGGTAGLVLARWVLLASGAMLPAEGVLLAPPELRLSVIVFTATLSLAVAVLFGIMPALRCTRPDLIATIRANAGHTLGARAAGRSRFVLVTVQVALSTALLTAAGLFINSLSNIARADLGLEADGLVFFGVSPERNGYQPAARQALYERIEDEVAAIPGVTSVAASRLPLLSGRGWLQSVSVEGFQDGADVDDGARYNEIGPGYFATVDIPLLTGREFTANDGAGAPRVAIVNEAFVRKFGLARNPVGRRMAIGDSDDLDIRIVGVVADAKYHLVKAEPPPQYFLPYRQNDAIGTMYFYARTAGQPDGVLRALPGVMSRLDRNMPIEDLGTLPQQIDNAIYRDRMIGTLSTLFAVLATVLAAVGLYGVLAYTVSQRTREFGVRMALGAPRRSVRRLVLRQVARTIALGIVAGIFVAAAMSRAARSLLFEVEGLPPQVAGGAIAVLTAVAAIAAYVPARKASRVDPMIALRTDR